MANDLYSVYIRKVGHKAWRKMTSGSHIIEEANSIVENINVNPKNPIYEYKIVEARPISHKVWG